MSVFYCDVLIRRFIVTYSYDVHFNVFLFSVEPFRKERGHPIQWIDLSCDLEEAFPGQDSGQHGQPQRQEEAERLRPQSGEEER